MATSDIIYALAHSCLHNDKQRVRILVEQLIAQESKAKHTLLADRLKQLLKNDPQTISLNRPGEHFKNLLCLADLAHQYQPDMTLEDLILPCHVRQTCLDILEEHRQRDLLQRHGIGPRNRLLLTGPPGNGKTSLAGAMALALGLPLFVLRYDTLIREHLGQTTTNIRKLFDSLQNNPCVLFIDEFESIAKERNDIQEVGEMKRCVSTLLLLIDQMMDTNILITATNHPQMLDSAVWRRFDVKLELPQPGITELEMYLKALGDKYKVPQLHISLDVESLQGKSFSEAKTLALDIVRKCILHPEYDVMQILEQQTQYHDTAITAA